MEVRDTPRTNWRSGSVLCLVDSRRIIREGELAAEREARFRQQMDWTDGPKDYCPRFSIILEELRVANEDRLRKHKKYILEKIGANPAHLSTVPK